MWIRRASRGRFERPLSAKEMLGKEASMFVRVGCEGGGSDWEGFGWLFGGAASTGGASVSAMMAIKAVE